MSAGRGSSAHGNPNESNEKSDKIAVTEIAGSRIFTQSAKPLRFSRHERTKYARRAAYREFMLVVVATMEDAGVDGTGVWGV